MSMTMTQKILADHAGLPEVKAGQLIEARLDMVLGNDITSPVAINEFEKAGFDQVFDKSKISLVMDTILHRTKILKLHSSASRPERLQENLISTTFTMSEMLELSMHFSLRWDL